MSVLARLAEHAVSRPRARVFAITLGDGVVSVDFAALFDSVRRLARGLEERGIGAGERVALVLSTSPELVALVFATQALGAIPMLVSPALPEPAIARRIAQVGAALVVDARTAASLAIDGAAPRGWSLAPRLDAIAYLQLTSGTTGEPRAAAVTHRALTHCLDGLPTSLAMRDGDAAVGWVPLHHDLGLVRFLFAPVYLGLETHLLPPSLASLGPWLHTLSRVRATITGAPDFAYRLAARTVPADGIDLSGLRVATNGGEPVRASTIAAFERRFACPGVIRPGYGLAEATLGVAVPLPGAPLRIDAKGQVGCGRTVPGVSLRVTRDGAVVAPGVVGDLETSGPTMFSGYWDPGAPGGLDRGTFTADGWLGTGDTGYVDADGELFVLGRTRAMVKQAGALIAPREVEELVDALPGVRLSAAIGLHNESRDSEELVIVLEARSAEGCSELAAAAHAAVRERVGVAPGRIAVVAPRTIPLTPNGKIRHAALKELFETGALP